MGRPPTRAKKLRDGYYIEVKNKGSKSGIKVRRETIEEMNRAANDYIRTKEVTILGECQNGKWIDDPIVVEKD